MSRPVRLWQASVIALVGLCGASALCGCSQPSQRLTLHDTEGRSFAAQCSSAGCQLQAPQPASPSSPNPGGAQACFELHPASRLWAVCEVWKQSNDSFSITPSDCRALDCQSDEQCPPAQGLRKGVCAHSLCIEPSAPISAEDVILLCLAGTGAPNAATHAQVERAALGSNCGSPCRVPSVCRQP